MSNSKPADKPARVPFHEEFAGRIVKMLEAGTAPWQKPWTPAENLAPRNPASGTVYRGVNRLHLSMAGYDDPRWMTLKQANDAGYSIIKGSRSTPILFYQFTKEQDKLDDNGKPVLDGDGNAVRETVELERPIMRMAHVFNASQIEGIPALERDATAYEWNPQEKAEKVLSNSGAVIKHDQRDRAFYRPSTDEIHLPPKDRFDQSDKYYATALHELGHWTGHSSRMNRTFGPFGTETYAKEELRAEIASWMVGQDTGVGHDPGQHAAYVKSWVKVLQEDPAEILRACRDAEHIRDYVLGLEMKKEQSIGQEASKDQPERADKQPARDPAVAKTWLYVPYREKEKAKGLGARWDNAEKRWYAPKGTDLIPLKGYMSPPEQQQQRPAPAQNLDPREEFAAKLADLGLDLKGQLPELDGRIHRVPLQGKRDRDGAYCLYGDGVPAGWAQNYSSGEKIKLVASGVVLAPEERERQQQERAGRLREAEARRAKEHDQAAKRCKEMFDRFSPASDDAAYLTAKGVQAFGVKEDQGNVIVPMRNINGDFRGFQAIAPDGQKAFATGVEKKGNFHLIGDEKNLGRAEILLCEGYATGASLHMATGKPVAVAFDSGNLTPVAEAIRGKYPRAAITICADNDHAQKRDGKPHNVGVIKAREAANKVRGIVKVPSFTAEEKRAGLTDFNDLHKWRGLGAVSAQVQRNQEKEIGR